MTTVEQIKAARKAGVSAAMAVAQDIAEGKLDTAQLDAAVAAEVRALFGRVEGPGDPLWDLHVDVARQVLAVGGGVSSVELAEWTAVYRAAEGVEAAPAGSWIEDALAQYDDEDVSEL
ncbi:flagellar hook-length control protein [Mycolicibacterium fortuitum]|uniref:flagellar hook-length control protein n=1 Tax=Mycolicibacterium fortuitum TaxID=1766 RepID=UPI000970004A|nr:flagellar hook-length control protein [Mycolicibacterium fortuitum]OMC08528.1 flagellar hook-length control protein [Mycolicibacterium fortuitum]